MKAERPFPPELWERIPAVVQDSIDSLDARVTALETAIQRLEATVQHLMARLHQDSRTSSRPPSSDPPQALGRRPCRAPRGRRPGGLPGHEGQSRALVAIEPVEVVISGKSERCARCQHPWHGEDHPPPRHPVTERPP
jgi:transposase